MKFIIKNDLKENIINLARKISYRFLNQNRETKEMNFIRPLERGGYPRFHLYLKINPAETQKIIFNLHLDQKKPIYEGATAHSGEYNGEVIEKEAERIKQILQQ